MPDLRSDYLQFSNPSLSESGKTLVWDVHNKAAGAWLGTIKWHGAFRKYTFWPVQGTGYDPACLRDLARFCEDQTMLHQARPKAS